MQLSKIQLKGENSYHGSGRHRFYIMFSEDEKVPHGAREHVVAQAAYLLDAREQRVG